jgi:uncharacterized protein YoxC
MAKELTRRVSTGAVEGVLRSVMPELLQRLDAIQMDIRHLDAKVDNLRQEMDHRFEQTRDVINEVGQRVARLEGRMDGFARAVERQSDKMESWIERLVQVEMTQDGRRKKRAG